MMTGTWHSFLVRAGLVVAGVSAPVAANADTRRAPAGNASEVTGADREKAEREAEERLRADRKAAKRWWQFWIRPPQGRRRPDDADTA